MIRGASRFVLIALALAGSAATAKKNIAARGEDLLLLETGTVKVGIDRAKGAAITWLSSAAYPKNLVNSADPGRLLAGVRAAGPADNTVVVFLSDNGMSHKAEADRELATTDWAKRNVHGLRGHKTTVWENGICVPLLVRWPARIAPGERNRFGAVEDVLPKILDLAGLRPDSVQHLPVAGLSLRPALFDADLVASARLPSRSRFRLTDRPGRRMKPTPARAVWKTITSCSAANVSSSMRSPAANPRSTNSPLIRRVDRCCRLFSGRRGRHVRRAPRAMGRATRAMGRAPRAMGRAPRAMGRATRHRPCLCDDRPRRAEPRAEKVKDRECSSGWPRFGSNSLDSPASA